MTHEMQLAIKLQIVPINKKKVDLSNVTSLWKVNFFTNMLQGSLQASHTIENIAVKNFK